MSFTEDLDIYFADFGKTAVFGAETGKVLLNIEDQVLGGGKQISTEYRITYKAGLFSTLARGSSITVDSVSYSVRNVFKKDDGQLYYAYLSKEE